VLSLASWFQIFNSWTLTFHDFEQNTDKCQYLKCVCPLFLTLRRLHYTINCLRILQQIYDRSRSTLAPLLGNWEKYRYRGRGGGDFKITLRLWNVPLSNAVRMPKKKIFYCVYFLFLFHDPNGSSAFNVALILPILSAI